MNHRGAQIVISQQLRRRHPTDIDAEIYKRRHLIENVFETLEFEAIAMPREKNTETSVR